MSWWIDIELNDREIFAIRIFNSQEELDQYVDNRASDVKIRFKTTQESKYISTKYWLGI